MLNIFNIQKDFFRNGTTREYEFRLDQLKKLRKTIEIREDDILTALSIDLRKPRFEAYTSEVGLLFKELDEAIKNLKYWMKREKVSTPIYLKPAKSYIKPVPKGVVLILSPWNYPFLLSLSPLIGAIAGGNCVILKPSNKSLVSSNLIKEIIQSTFPENYIHVIEGPGSEVVEPLIMKSNFDHIFFTGSKEIGKIIAKLAAEKFTTVTLELGGKSPAIVDETTDIDMAAKKITWAKFFNTGQTCIAPDYILIPEFIKNEFIEKMKKYIQEFYGDDIINSSDYGRIINIDQFNKLIHLMDDLKIIYGGEHNSDELYIQPTIVKASVNDNIMKEEIFGPILPIITYKDGYDVFNIIDLNPNPLALYLFTNDDNFKHSIINNISFGGGCINDTMSHMINTNLPFGGVRDSGMGRYHSNYSFKEFTNFKSIVESNNIIDINIKYPPYSERKRKISKFFLK